MGACEPSTRPIGSLIVGGRVLVDENALSHKIRELLIASVSQEQRLAAVANENESVMGNNGLVHFELRSNKARFARTDRVKLLRD